MSHLRIPRPHHVLPLLVVTLILTAFSLPMAEAGAASTSTTSSRVTSERARATTHAHWILLSRRTKLATTTPTTYRSTVGLRSTRRPGVATLHIRQVVAGTVVASRTASASVTRSAWRTFRVTLQTTTQASYVETWATLRTLRAGHLLHRGLTVARVVGSSVPPDRASGTTLVPSTTWKPDMVENFDTLSTSRWNVRNNTYASNEDSYMLARNTTIDHGALRIQGKHESAGGRHYTSGYVDSIGKYTLPTYFRAEVRAKVPFQQGLWAAPLWFRPSDGRDGEIDLIETYGKERTNPLVHQTIHTAYGASHQQVALTKPYSTLNAGSATDWHTYTVEKTAHSITMWTDGIVTARFTPANPSWFDRYYEAGKRWNLRINMQIGGDYGRLPDATTNWSPDTSAMQLDYIKTWTLTGS